MESGVFGIFYPLLRAAAPLWTPAGQWKVSPFRAAHKQLNQLPPAAGWWEEQVTLKHITSKLKHLYFFQ